MSATAEANTYGLPRGEPIRRALAGAFREQRKWALEQVATLRPAVKAQPAGDDIPDLFAEMPYELGDLKMSERMTPLLEVYWEDSGESLFSRLKLDPRAWRVTNPHVASKIQSASLSFCQSTNATTSKALNVALADLRGELVAGVATTGEAIPKLTKRVNSIFDSAEKSRARRIAQTEASRAVHAGQEEAAKQSGLVAGWEWLLSSDACPLCQMIGRRAKYVRLDQPFAVIGDNPSYSSITHPPLHPHCNCTVVEVLHADAENTPWAPTLVQPEPEAEDYPNGVVPGTKPSAMPSWVKPVAIGAGVVGATVGVAVVLPRLLPLIQPIAQALPEAAQVVHDLSTIAGRIEAYGDVVGRSKLAKLAGLEATWRSQQGELPRLFEAAEGALRKAQRAAGEFRTPAVQLAEAAIEQLAQRRQLLAEARTAMPALAADVVGVPEADRMALTGKWLESHPANAAIVAGREWLEKVTAADASLPKGLRVDHARVRGANNRAFYDPSHRKAWIADADTPEIVVHEMGHALEHQLPGVGAQAMEFVAHRTEGESLQKLSKLFPGAGYQRWETGKNFKSAALSAQENYYAGKVYKVGRAKVAPTEVMAMGLQQLFRDPVGFAQKDPQFCMFVMGMLDGGLRPS